MALSWRSHSCTLAMQHAGGCRRLRRAGWAVGTETTASERINSVQSGRPSRHHTSTPQTAGRGPGTRHTTDPQARVWESTASAQGAPHWAPGASSRSPRPVCAPGRGNTEPDQATPVTSVTPVAPVTTGTAGTAVTPVTPVTALIRRAAPSSSRSPVPPAGAKRSLIASRSESW